MSGVPSLRADANPTVRRARYRIGGDATLKTTPEGGLTVEAGGVRIASADSPVMWGTVKRHGASDITAPDFENEPVKTARVGSAISAGHLVLPPDPSMLADPGARFPLVIDPLFVTARTSGPTRRPIARTPPRSPPGIRRQPPLRCALGTIRPQPI
jgi:hypothetical protein